MHVSGSCHCGAIRFSVKSRAPYPFMLCYCSICRKTAGGGGYAINIIGEANTLSVQGDDHLSEYRARQQDGNLSQSRRKFCRDCGSALWVADDRWPEWIYPFASAIDTPLPAPPLRVHMMESYRVPWGRRTDEGEDDHFAEYPQCSILDWHQQRGLLDPD